jgi:hypothetical protein
VCNSRRLAILSCLLAGFCRLRLRIVRGRDGGLCLGLRTGTCGHRDDEGMGQGSRRVQMNEVRFKINTAITEHGQIIP